MGEFAGFDPVRKVLENGLTVIVVENHNNASVVLHLLTKAGNVYETNDEPGLANFVSKALDRGTQRYTKDELADSLDYLGAEMNISSGQHTSVVGFSFLSEHLTEIFKLARSIFLEPTFPLDELDKLRGEIISSIKENLNDTRWVVEVNVRELIFPGTHPYCRRIEGRVEAIEHFTQSDLSRFHSSFYKPRQSIAIVVGDVDANTVFREVDEQFGDWKSIDESSTEIDLEIELQNEIREKITPMMNKTQADIALGFKGISRGDADYYNVQVMNTILGQYGMGGRLGNNIREALGLAYYVYSLFSANFGEDLFMVRAGVDRNDVDEAVENIINELSRIKREGVTELEVDETKKYLVGSMPRRIETNRGIATMVQNQELFSLGMDYYRKYPEIINAVPKDKINEAAEKYLYPERYSLAIAGPYER